jgi:hypothetical protein
MYKLDARFVLRGQSLALVSKVEAQKFFIFRRPQHVQLLFPR